MSKYDVSKNTQLRVSWLTKKLETLDKPGCQRVDKNCKDMINLRMHNEDDANWASKSGLQTFQICSVWFSCDLHSSKFTQLAVPLKCNRLQVQCERSMFSVILNLQGGIIPTGSTHNFRQCSTCLHITGSKKNETYIDSWVPFCDGRSWLKNDL